MDEKLPPPRASPRPVGDRSQEIDDALGVGEKTDPKMIVDAEYLKRVLGRDADQLKHSGWIRTAVTVVGSTVVSLAAAILVVFNVSRAVAQDAGQTMANRVTTLEQQRKEDRGEADNRFIRMEQNQNADHGLILGVSQKLDVLLQAQGVRNPAPTPKDAGR